MHVSGLDQTPGTYILYVFNQCLLVFTLWPSFRARLLAKLQSSSEYYCKSPPISFMAGSLSPCEMTRSRAKWQGHLHTIRPWLSKKQTPKHKVFDCLLLNLCRKVIRFPKKCFSNVKDSKSWNQKNHHTRSFPCKCLNMVWKTSRP